MRKAASVTGKLARKFGRAVARDCLAAVRDEFLRPGGWASDNPERARFARKAALAHHEVGELAARGTIKKGERDAYAEREIFGKWRGRGRPPLHEDFLRMESRLMDILTRSGCTAKDAAQWTFDLIDAQGLLPLSEAPRARYSPTAIYGRWKERDRAA